MGLNETTINVAFIGAGNMTREHIKAFSALDNVNCVGISSRTVEKAQTLADEFDIPHVCTTIEELYNTTKADLVVVAVSVAAMFKVSSEAAQYNWALLLEKPPAIDLEEAQTLQTICDQHSTPAYVVLNRRFLSSTISAKDNLDKNDQPRFISVQDQQPLEAIKNLGVHPDIVIENWMYANSIHLIDYFSNFCRGAVTNVTVLEPWQCTQDTEMVVAHITYDSGDRGVYECRFKGPGPWAATISTQNIRWELKPLEHAAYINDGDRTVHNVEQNEADQNFKPGFFVQSQKIIKAIRGEKNNAPTLQDCITTMDLISKIYA